MTTTTPTVRIEDVKRGMKFVAKKGGKTHEVQGYHSASQPMADDRPFAAWVFGKDGELVRRRRIFRIPEVRTWP